MRASMVLLPRQATPSKRLAQVKLCESVHLQLHVNIAHDLPTNPDNAYTSVQQKANNVEARLAGEALIGNNLAARLSGVRQDALYAEVLFLFLSLPGVVLAILLTLTV